VEKGISFWEQVMKMVTFLKDEAAVTEEVFNQFSSANTLLQSQLNDLRNM
jgi:hypothetical protein